MDEVPKNSILLKGPKQIPTITIFTDAAFDNELKVGAWACYIRIGLKVIQSSRIIEVGTENSTEAERVGVAVVLWILNQKVDLGKYKLIIYCDNGAAARPVKLYNKTGNAKQQAKKQLKFYQTHIEPLLQKAKMVDIRYIKGHAARNKNFKLKDRHLVHDMVDRQAGLTLDEFRRKLEPSIPEKRSDSGS
jgi:ribonuclease HI